MSEQRAVSLQNARLRWQTISNFIKEIAVTTKSNFLAVSGAFLFAGLIGGCATGASTSGAMGGGMSGMGAGQMDMQAMCEKHKAMMAGKSTAEQQAIMSEHMKSMSPEMRTRMQTMYETCKAS